jgi:starch synthase (maltosyl-transferring)
MKKLLTGGRSGTVTRYTRSVSSTIPRDGRCRVVALGVRPEIDGGRYPVKRITGEPLAVEADLVADGHDVLRGMLRYRRESETAWHEVELTHTGNDTWSATITLTEIGRYRYTVAGWVDAFATWRRGLERKFAAGVDVSLELREGARLVEAAGLDASELTSKAPIAERVAYATGELLGAAMAGVPDRRHQTVYRHELEVVVERPLAGFSSWYELFPRSTGAAGKHGTFRDAEGRLDYVAELGFDVIYLPPIHPIGLGFRKGPDNSPTAGPTDPGSPWAIGAAAGGHTSVHPELGTLADFERFRAAAAERGICVALDIAFQASPDHPWVKEHPTWFKQRPDGSIQYAENPPKKYQDVYPFDFESDDWEALWQALRGVIEFWCERGVRVFRVDNPHTKPIPFWEWCIREVQTRFPDAIFLAEAFTRPKLTYALSRSGYSQSYTYFTWRTTKPELEQYLVELTRTDLVEHFRPNFWPTTPDIFPEYLAHGGRGAFVGRLVLAATLASNYGIYGPSYELMEAVQRPGTEELAKNEKYQLRQWDLGRADSLRFVMARLNQIRRAHPALQQNRTLRFHKTDNDLMMAYSKRAGDDVILVVVNLDPHHTHGTWLELSLDELGVAADHTFQVHDLLGDGRFTWRGPRNYVELVPQQLPAHIFAIRPFVRSENQFEYFL